ncbi:GTPase [Infirmifilum uzonense]|uniref:GTPase n=1 Tax=Infirmifilum uzonense TaxID=1550241 RepID=A0A0F7FHY3_9CREN|nr:cyclic 2,3-diphosphoglycerate synthase [Infirmifilum uzonense]AKG38905.1 GTPase [Infirmifilum uzonense]
MQEVAIYRRRKVIIMGAAGRDFHNFNVLFRNDSSYEVVAFTATQIPFIDNRKYPPELAGPLYPEGIPIYPERMIEELIKKYKVDEVYLSYSDLRFHEVMDKASRVTAAGANFILLGAEKTMLRSVKPVIAVTASRTGAGKSTITRYVTRILREAGVRFTVVRHPMPYGDLRKSVVQRFSTFDDLDYYNCTIEEREEYEPHLAMGNIVYAGVDYEKILREAEKESDIIIWDGGNNDWPFFKPDLYITIADPTRPDDVLGSYPGYVNVKLADVIVINKVNAVEEKAVEVVLKSVREVNDKAKIVYTASELSVDAPELIRNKKVVVVEDGPTVTHGSLSFAAGYNAARQFGAREIIDPRPYAVGSIADAYKLYPHLGPIVPALGYSEAQIRELEETLNRIPADAIVMGTPSDLRRYLKLNKPAVRVFYEAREVSVPGLREIIHEFISSRLKV